MKYRLLLIFSLCYAIQTKAQTEKLAWYYCIDHPAKTIYHAYGKAIVKAGLNKIDYYQYGFMKQQGWINKSWNDLTYHIFFITAENKSIVISDKNKLLREYRNKNYQLKEVPMPYPMIPYDSYKKDGTNGHH